MLKNKNVSADKSFQDVQVGAWYAEAVNALASLDILSGYEDGTFLSEQSITHDEFTAIVVKFVRFGNRRPLNGGNAVIQTGNGLVLTRRAVSCNILLQKTAKHLRFGGLFMLYELACFT